MSPVERYLFLDALKFKLLQVSCWRCANNNNRPVMPLAMADEADTPEVDNLTYNDRPRRISV